MPTLLAAVSGNADAWETSHSINIDVGAAAAGRRIVGFLSRHSDATERINTAAQITLGGSSTGVTLAGTSTNPVGQAGSFYARSFDIDVPAGLSGVQALVITSSDATARRTGFVAACYSDGGVPTFTYGSNSFNNNPTATIGSATGEEVGLFIISITASQTITPGTGSSAITGALGGTGMTFLGLRENGAASVTIDGTFSGSDEYCCVAWTLPSAGPAAEMEQEGTRFGNDDGSESAHTFAAAQDANITAALAANLLLRALINGTGDPATAAFTLRYQKNGAGGYVAVPVGSTTAPTLSYGAAGAWAYSALDGTSVAPSYPTGITVNSGLVAIVFQKPNTANGGTATTPSGWSLIGSRTGANDGNTGGYTTTLGADTGNMNLFVYAKDTVTGSESGTLTITVSDNEVCGAVIVRLQASGTATWSWEVATGKDTSAGSVSIATGNINITAGDHILAGMAIPTDVTTPTQFSAEALAQTGTTFGTVNEVSEADTTTGNDMGGFLVEAAVSSGSGTGAATLTATAGGTTTNVRGPGFVLRARVTGVARELYVATSSNIAGGGEATTARLTAPSGKTTSDFVTGRRWDDENGTDSIDITVDDYTELEWCLRAQSPAVNGDYFDFRVYAGANPLTTYTVTPRWTIGTPAGALPPGLFRSHAARLAPLLNRR